MSVLSLNDLDEILAIEKIIIIRPTTPINIDSLAADLIVRYAACNFLSGFLNSGGILFDPLTLNRGYFRKESVQRIIDEHMQHKVDNGYKIGSLLMLELWHREFIDSF